MRARDVIGRRIVAVEQEHVPTRDGEHPEYVWVLGAIVLDNGDRITVTTVETELGDYYQKLLLHKAHT